MTVESLRARRSTQDAVLIAAQAIALLGVFPFGLLYGFPVLAAVTLRDAHRWLRLLALIASTSLFTISLVVDLAKR